MAGKVREWRSDQEIDKLVYNLHELTDYEIKIIEETAS